MNIGGGGVSPTWSGSKARFRVAVIVATFNRPEITIRALRSMASATKQADIEVKLFLADASTDDTTKSGAVALYPDAEVIAVPSTSYWASSMRVAWEHAQRWDYDFVMWLNDDVTLYEHALQQLISTSTEAASPAAAVGATQDPETSELTYGGKRRGPWFAPLHGPGLIPAENAQKIGVFHGNIVLIPKAVDDSVGGFPAGYLHNMADTAYGLRLRKSKFTALLCPGFLGSCSANPDGDMWRDPSLQAKTRWAHLRSPKGRPFPYWFKLCREIGGFSWPLYLLSGHIKVLASFLKVSPGAIRPLNAMKTPTATSQEGVNGS